MKSHSIMKALAVMGAGATLLALVFIFAVEQQEAPAERVMAPHVRQEGIGIRDDATPAFPEARAPQVPDREKTRVDVPPLSIAEEQESSESTEAIDPRIQERTDPLESENRESAKEVMHPVPFISQAPLGDWGNPRRQDACEEASILMVGQWLSGIVTAPSEAEADRMIETFVQDEVAFQGYFEDTSAADTAVLLRRAYPNAQVAVTANVTVDSIRTAIDSGAVLIVPVNGQLLGNPYFTQPGPLRHMVVVYGYDNVTGTFHVHDPGLRRIGRDYHYPYGSFLGAIRDYPSGVHRPITSADRRMIIVHRPE